MRKIYLIVFAIIFSMSCSKENPVNELQETNQKEFLMFKSVTDYENTIHQLSSKTDVELKDWCKINNPNAIILQKSRTDLESLGIYDMLLASLLNNEGIISINQNVFNIDINKDKVKVIHANDYQNVTDFNSKSLTKEFTTEQDVLEIIANGIETEATKGCDNSGCGSNDYKPSNWYLSGEGKEIDRKIVYQKAGIYFSLQAKIKRTDLSWGGQTMIGLSVNTSYAFDSKYRKKRTCTVNHISPNSQGNNGREYNIRAYESSTGLQGYRFTIHFWAYDQDVSYMEVRKLSCHEERL